MRDDVRIAADGRGEVAVARAGEPCVPDVAGRVVRLLLGAEHERAERPPAVAGAAHVVGHQPAGLARHVARLLRAHVPGRGRRGHVEAGELVQQALDGGRVRPVVDPVEGREPAPGEVVRHPLVREDHQLLDHAVRLGLRLVPDPDHVAALVELERRLGRLHLERAAPAAPLPQRRGHLAGGRQRLAPGRGGRLVSGEDAVHLVVGEPGVAPDPRAMERHRPGLGPVHQELDGHRQPLLPGHQAAGTARQRLRKHRLDRPRHIHAGGPAGGLPLERGARPHVRAHVGDVDPYADPAAVRALRRHRVVVVARGDRVDGEGRQPGEVAPLGPLALAGRRLGHIDGLGLHGAREREPEAPVEHQRAQHVPGHIRVAEGAHDARAALSPAQEHDVPGRGAGAADRAVEGHPPPALEQRLGHQEAAALREDRDERPFHAPASRRGPRRRAHRIFAATTSSAIGRASSRRVFGTSRAGTVGTMPLWARFAPLGRK